MSIGGFYHNPLRHSAVALTFRPRSVSVTLNISVAGAHISAAKYTSVCNKPAKATIHPQHAIDAKAAIARASSVVLLPENGMDASSMVATSMSIISALNQKSGA